MVETWANAQSLCVPMTLADVLEVEIRIMSNELGEGPNPGRGVT